MGAEESATVGRIRLLRLIDAHPDKPGNWSGFPVNLRGYFQMLEHLNLAEWRSHPVEGGGPHACSGGWFATDAGKALVAQFKPLPRPKVKP